MPNSADVLLPPQKLREECAVVAIWNNPKAGSLCQLCLHALQHRGQEGSGITTSDGSKVQSHKAMGLVSEVYPNQIISHLRGNYAIGHNRYSTCGCKEKKNLQPLVGYWHGYPIAIAHNGNITNVEEIKKELADKNIKLSTSSDTELILQLILLIKKEKDIKKALRSGLQKIKGAYSLVILYKKNIFGIRDPAGIRPLSLGKLKDSYVIASETCAFDLIGAKLIRDIRPNEILQINPEGQITSLQITKSPQRAFCVFEYIYFSRPDSNILNENVYNVRKNLGRQLAIEQPADADIVVPVPDSGLPAAVGYSQQSNIPMELGLVRSHYSGRTFIQPTQEKREAGVKSKLNPIQAVIKNKKVVLIDDSIVRGTTAKQIIKMLKDAGAKEVHLRLSCPPIKSYCPYGIDIPTESELISSSKTTEELKAYIDANSVGFLSLEGLYNAIGKKRNNFCDGCLTKKYKV